MFHLFRKIHVHHEIKIVPKLPSWMYTYNLTLVSGHLWRDSLPQLGQSFWSVALNHYPLPPPGFPPLDHNHWPLSSSQGLQIRHQDKWSLLGLVSQNWPCSAVYLELVNEHIGWEESSIPPTEPMGFTVEIGCGQATATIKITLLCILWYY